MLRIWLVLVPGAVAPVGGVLSTASHRLVVPPAPPTQLTPRALSLTGFSRTILPSPGHVFWLAPLLSLRARSSRYMTMLAPGAAYQPTSPFANALAVLEPLQVETEVPSTRSSAAV